MKYYYLAKVCFDDDFFVLATAPLDSTLSVGESVEVRTDKRLQRGTIGELVYVSEEDELFQFVRRNITLHKIVNKIVPLRDD